MDLKHISELVETLCASNAVTELSVREGSTRLTLRRALAQTTREALAAAPEPPAIPVVEWQSVRSPLVGIFHARAAAAQAPLSIGKQVREGQILGAIESMRMLYEVACEVNGTVAEVMVEDEQPVEYGQELFRIQPGTANLEDTDDPKDNA